MIINEKLKVYRRMVKGIARKVCILGSELQISWAIDDNFEIIFFVLVKCICYDPSLELSCSDSN